MYTDLIYLQLVQMENCWKVIVSCSKTSGEASPPSMQLLSHASQTLRHEYQVYADVAFRP